MPTIVVFGLVLLLLSFPIAAFSPLIAQARVQPSASAPTEVPTSLEVPVCKGETSLIELAKAGIQNPDAVIKWEQYRDTLRKDQFTTKDGRTINGLVWKAKHPRGYLLIAQGTSMKAAEIYEIFDGSRLPSDWPRFTNLDLDVYIYDYRGYPPSTGNTSLRAIIADYTQRITELNAVPEYKYRFLYGVSLGGVVFTKIIQTHIAYTALILDSVPHEIQWYPPTPWRFHCPDDYDPVKALPADCSNWLVIAGGHDKVVGTRARQLLEKTEKCNAQRFYKDEFGHIFTDNGPNTLARLQRAFAFLKQQMPPPTVAKTPVEEKKPCTQDKKAPSETRASSAKKSKQ